MKLLRSTNSSDMDKRAVLEIAKRYANVVGSKYDFVSIFLFGSFAKGNYNEDSDIDIAVVLKDYDNLIEIQLDLMRLRRNIDSRIEPHPFREKDFTINNPVVNEIVKYGQSINLA